MITQQLDIVSIDTKTANHFLVLRNQSNSVLLALTFEAKSGPLLRVDYDACDAQLAELKAVPDGSLRVMTWDIVQQVHDTPIYKIPLRIFDRQIILRSEIGPYYADEPTLILSAKYFDNVNIDFVNGKAELSLSEERFEALFMKTPEGGII